MTSNRPNSPQELLKTVSWVIVPRSSIKMFIVCWDQLLINFSSLVVLLNSSLSLWVSVVLSVAARGVEISDSDDVFIISSSSPCRFLFHMSYSSGV